MSLKPFHNFYLKFIKLVAKLEFLKEILLQEFMYKLFPCIHNKMNSRLEYSDNIKDLIMRF